jgi:hypothetical protein
VPRASVRWHHSTPESKRLQRVNTSGCEENDELTPIYGCECWPRVLAAGEVDRPKRCKQQCNTRLAGSLVTVRIALMRNSLARKKNGSWLSCEEYRRTRTQLQARRRTRPVPVHLVVLVAAAAEAPGDVFRGTPCKSVGHLLSSMRDPFVFPFAENCPWRSRCLNRPSRKP